jgi:hypothetical protein
LQECLNLLVGDSGLKTALPTEVQADDFAENILGFEEVEEIEGEEGALDGSADMSGSVLGGGTATATYRGAPGMGIIPEEH